MFLNNIVKPFKSELLKTYIVKAYVKETGGNEISKKADNHRVNKN